MRKIMFGLLVVGLLAAEEKKQPDDPLKKVQGAWVVVSVEQNGTRLPGDANNRFVFERDSLRSEYKDSRFTGPIKLDATAKPGFFAYRPNGGPRRNETVYMIFEFS